MVSYQIYESDKARAERRNRLMQYLVIIMLVAVIATNAAWIIAVFC